MAEKIRYKDFLDYAERLSFAENARDVEKGNEFLGLLDKIDEGRAERGDENNLYLTKDELSFVLGEGFETLPFWEFLKDGKTSEFNSPLMDYQDAYIEYMTSPLADKEHRESLFEELKDTENILTGIDGLNYKNYMPLTRGELDASQLSKQEGRFKDIPVLKQNAYGRNGLKGQLNAVYADLKEHHNPVLIDTLRKLDSITSLTDIATNNAKLYSSCEFVTGKDGKEELLYTVNAPTLEKSRIGGALVKDNEAVTIRITDKGIDGMKYTDFNLYYDELEVDVYNPKNGKTELKTGKMAANYLKEHPNDDYPDPSKIQQIKVDNKLMWAYVQPDMSYPEKGAEQEFTADYAGINSSIASDRLKAVSKEIEKFAIEQSKEHSWAPVERAKDLGKTIEVSEKDR